MTRPEAPAVTTPEPPQFEHDCMANEADPNDQCHFLGRAIRLVDGKNYDLYWHPSQHCAIARMSDEGSDYLSVTLEGNRGLSMTLHNEALAEARRRAIRAGWL